MIRLLTVLTLTLLLLPACAAQRVAGVVVDRASGKPIPDVFVIAVWQVRGADPVGSRTGCVELQVKKTDWEGRFEFQSESTFRRDPDFFFYKPGLERAPWAPYRAHERQWDKLTIEMMPLKQSAEERVSEHQSYWWLITCGNRMKAIEALRELLAANDAEAKTLVFTDPKRKPIDDLYTLRLQEALQEERQRSDENKASGRTR